MYLENCRNRYWITASKIFIAHAKEMGGCQRNGVAAIFWVIWCSCNDIMCMEIQYTYFVCYLQGNLLVTVLVIDITRGSNGDHSFIVLTIDGRCYEPIC